jgi:hypothetical protein
VGFSYEVTLERLKYRQYLWFAASGMQEDGGGSRTPPGEEGGSPLVPPLTVLSAPVQPFFKSLIVVRAPSGPHEIPEVDVQL